MSPAFPGSTAVVALIEIGDKTMLLAVVLKARLGTLLLFLALGLWQLGELLLNQDSGGGLLQLALTRSSRA